MNVAHQDKDFYNPEQKRMRKAAGTTPEERSSFAVKLLGRDPPPSCVVTAATAAPVGRQAPDSQTPPPLSAPAMESATRASSSRLEVEAAKFIGVRPGQEEVTGDSDSGDKNRLTNAEEKNGCLLVDTFRERYPDATGVFSYWSVRAGNRAVNRGMRLDYCLASRVLVDGGVENATVGEGGVVHDAFVLDRETVGVSDHCPVGVVFRLGDHYDE